MGSLAANVWPEMSIESKWVFATNNLNKLKEAQLLLSGKVNILSLNDIGCLEELPETHETLEENSLEKAAYIYNKYNVNCFAEDTGLEVETLNGEPGVYSARYAGEEKDNNANMDLLLEKLKGIENRTARFKTVITLIDDGEIHQFEGIVNGKILAKGQGNRGFGYDPVFQPRGFNRSFAEMEMHEKSSISHRGKAMQQLTAFINNDVD